MEKLAKLKEDAAAADGWDQLLDDPVAAGWTMQNEQGETLIRTTIKVDMPPAVLFQMLYDSS